MTWPTVAVNTTNMDAGGDFASTARADILDMAQKLNLIITKGSRCAVSAQRATTEQTAGASVIFNSELDDDGAHYDPATGIFTAPTDDWYAYQVMVNIANTTGSLQSVTVRVEPAPRAGGQSSTKDIANGSNVDFFLSGCMRLNAAEQFYIAGWTISSTLRVTTKAGNGMQIRRMLGR